MRNRGLFAHETKALYSSSFSPSQPGPPDKISDLKPKVKSRNESYATRYFLFLLTQFLAFATVSHRFEARSTQELES
jgi:hypothetical protein